MPLRVKCRCGQELVLRYGEWIHALLGLLVLSLIVNGTALVVIVLQLGELKEAVRSDRARASVPAEAPAEKRVEVPAAPIEKEGSRDVRAGSVPAAAPPAPAAPEKSPSMEPAVERREDEKKDPAKETPPSASVPPGTEKTAPAVSRVPEGRQRIRLFSEGTPPLLRLLATQRCEELRVLIALILDEDEVVRRWALRRSLESKVPADPSAAKDLLRIALPAADALLLESGGRDLLRNLAGGDRGADLEGWWKWGEEAHGIDAARGIPEEMLGPLSNRAKLLLDTSPGAEALGKFLSGRDGKGSAEVDVLLAIDGTESMEEAAAEISRSGWLFHALAWAIPGLRMGLLFYQDDVGRTFGLGTDPSELAEALEGFRPEGGGDVPEGVPEALKAALQLGRFDWRPDADKQILFLGDGAPRRSEVPALLSLARECHAEGGYRIHAVSVSPAEGRTFTLYFPDIARAGGGKAVTALKGRIVRDVFLALLPSEAREDLERLFPALESCPTSGRRAPPSIPRERQSPPWKDVPGG